MSHGYAVSAVFHDPLPPGTPVLAWPITRNGSPLVTRTRGEVWTLGDGTRVVAVEGYAGGIALTHVDVLPQERTEIEQGEPIGELGKLVNRIAADGANGVVQISTDLLMASAIADALELAFASGGIEDRPGYLLDVLQIRSAVAQARVDLPDAVEPVRLLRVVGGDLA